MIDQMNRILLFLLLFSACLTACKKSTTAEEKIRAQLAIDNNIITNYLSAHSLTAKVVDSAGVSTGIYYIINEQGTGDDLYTAATQVTVGYTATLLTTGKQVVSTDTFHPSYALGGTLRGWQFGIPNVKKGGTITLYVPSHYAYGPYPQPTLGLPANAILIFKITVYNITN